MKDKFTEGTIEALGHGEVFAAPDEAIVTFEVVTQAKTAAKAVAENAEITKEVIDAVSDQPNHGVTTTGLSVWPVHQYDPETNIDKIIGFRATNGVRVRTKPGFAGQVYDAGIEAGANVSSGIMFRIEDETPLRAEALERAVDNAYKEAEIVAKAAEIDILGVRAIVIDPVMGPVYVSSEKIDADAVATPVMPEDLSVQANVRITFRMK
jgi:uncharacterized protein YggE